LQDFPSFPITRPTCANPLTKRPPSHSGCILRGTSSREAPPLQQILVLSAGLEPSPLFFFLLSTDPCPQVAEDDLFFSPSAADVFLSCSFWPVDEKVLTNFFAWCFSLLRLVILLLFFIMEGTLFVLFPKQLISFATFLIPGRSRTLPFFFGHTLVSSLMCSLFLFLPSGCPALYLSSFFPLFSTANKPDAFSSLFSARARVSRSTRLCRFFGFPSPPLPLP